LDDRIEGAVHAFVASSPESRTGRLAHLAQLQMSASFLCAAEQRAASIGMAQKRPCDCPDYKVIFLDVDGVLHPASQKGRPFHTQCMGFFVNIVQMSGAHICLSSNWRLDDKGIDMLNRRLRASGLQPMVGHTHPVEDVFNTRADEILDWLHRHPEVTHFVALDDVDLCYEDPAATMPTCIAPRFILTDEARGLQSRDVSAALAALQIPFERSELVPAAYIGAPPACLPPASAPPAYPVSATPDTARAMEARPTEPVLVGARSEAECSGSGLSRCGSRSGSRRNSRSDVLDGIVRD